MTILKITGWRLFMRKICCRNKSPYVVFLAAMISVMILFYFSSCEKKAVRIDSGTLAVIGSRTIDEDYFIKRYKDFRRQTGAADNGMARRSVLNNIIAEELLILEARHRGFDRDAMGRHELERIKIQELLNAYHRKFVASHVSTTDEELKQLYVNLNIKIKARHLYAPTRQKADSIYHALQLGSSFEEIARSCFQDPLLRDSGGLLGYFTVDEMDPAFEEAAYSLKIGEISKPVRTNDGYSIIRVDDRSGNPMVSESEFAKHRSKLKAYWQQRKIRKATQQHADSLRHELNITFNQPVVQKFFQMLQEQKETRFIKKNDLIQGIFPPLKNDDLVYSKFGTWDVKKFQQAARFTSQQQQGWIRNEENLKDYIAGLVVRSFILDQAKKNKLDKTPSYKQRVAEDFDTALLERIEETLYNEFEIPDDTLRHYYDEDPTLFAEPPKVQLQQIELVDKDKIKFITSQLEQGASFADLAKKYSEDRRSAEKGGDLGYLRPNDLGKWAKQVLSMKVGEWMGPLEMNSSHIFLKCVDKIAEKARTFEEAKPDVEHTVRTLLWDRVRQQKIEAVRATVMVKSFPEKLIEIHVN